MAPVLQHFVQPPGIADYAWCDYNAALAAFATILEPAGVSRAQ
jgi:hypothetical protein